MSDVTPEQLGTETNATKYHPLALDSTESGAWGWIDRTGENASRWLNPILIKEARQALKSRQFTIIFFLLLAASLTWTVMGVAFNYEEIWYVPKGADLLGGYFVLLSIPMIVFVPMAAFRSLASEIDDGTFELLSITTLSSMRIVMGKLNSALLQMLVYFAAIVPCLAFSYLLRGVTIFMILSLILMVVFVSLLLTSFALMMATISNNRGAQTISLMMLMGGGLWAEGLCCMMCFELVLEQDIFSQSESLFVSSIMLLIGFSFVVLFIKAASAKIGPATENRSTGLRRWIFFQQSLWIGCVVAMAVWWDEVEMVTAGVCMLGLYWTGIGAFILSEAAELSPRVQRELPSTYFGRMMLTWFNPGPGTGFVFSIATSTVGLLGLGIFSILGLSRQNDESLTLSTAIVGYLCMYLGTTRIVVLLLTQRLEIFQHPGKGNIFRRMFIACMRMLNYGRLENSLALPPAVMIILMIAGCTLPTLLFVLTFQNTPSGYDVWQITNWVWALSQAIDRGTLQFSEASLILAAGAGVLVVNMILLVKELNYRRIAIPDRVLNETKQANAAESDGEELSPLA